MEEQEYYQSVYKGSKQFSQHDVISANASGFGAAADDYMDRGIDLNEVLIKNKPATYFLFMKGDSMAADGINDGDILLVDKSLPVADGKVIIAVLNERMIIRRIKITGDKTFLISGKKHTATEVKESDKYKYWGVVTYVIHKFM